MHIVTRDESPLVYRAPGVSEDSQFGTFHFGTSTIRDCTTAICQVTMYRQFARKVGTRANSSLIYTTKGAASLKSVLKIGPISTRTVSVRHQSSREFFYAYISPVRDLWIARFLRLSFGFFYDKNHHKFRHILQLVCYGSRRFIFTGSCSLTHGLLLS